MLAKRKEGKNRPKAPSSHPELNAAARCESLGRREGAFAIGYLQTGLRQTVATHVRALSAPVQANLVQDPIQVSKLHHHWGRLMKQKS